MTEGLCANPDCGAFLDDGRAVLFWDREEARYVHLCHECARTLHEGQWRRYTRVDQPSPTKGASP